MSRSLPSLSLALTALLLIPAGAAVGQEPSQEPVVLEPQPGSLVHGLPTGPDASVVDAAPTAWEWLEIGPDGRSLRVAFYSGVPECYGLARVEVVEQSGSVPVVTVWTGRLTGARDEACVEMAQLYHTDVLLDEPLVLDGASVGRQPIDGSAASAMGPGISISEIDEAPADEILLVNGYLLVGRDGKVRLWEALAESYPPQGAGRSLRVKGLDEDAIEWTEAQGVRWSEGVQLLGRIRDGTLIVADTAL